MKVSALDEPKCASQILDHANPQVLKLSKACFYGWGVRERPPLTSVLRREYLLLYHGVAPVCINRIWQSWVQSPFQNQVLNTYCDTLFQICV